MSPGKYSRAKTKDRSFGRQVLLAVLACFLVIVYFLWPEDDSVLAVESFTKTWRCQKIDSEIQDCISEECNGVPQNYMGDALVFDVSSEPKYPHLPILSANQCCNACKLHPNCNVWTYCRKPEGCGNDGSCLSMLEKGA
eukprot:TRINITY_DN4045_c0_g1_i5.p1 TRINITY_DN4045_c0_g1~~TRINITY_DN4045_c0_g1_i5.p1  ORF type:complete len:150 (-),score=14.18 TRINITY_DN4045_c0_g1_i5:58-474(-)